MGGVRFRKFSELARSIWKWCEEHDISIFASYITSKDNVEADIESRRTNKETEFELSDVAFRQIVKKFGYPVINLFTSRINTKCKGYISWSRDPDSITVDAFTINWNNFFFYAFPPFIIITRVLQKIKAERVEGIVVVPQ